MIEGIFIHLAGPIRSLTDHRLDALRYHLEADRLQFGRRKQDHRTITLTPADYRIEDEMREEVRACSDRLQLIQRGLKVEGAETAEDQ